MTSDTRRLAPIMDETSVHKDSLVDALFVYVEHGPSRHGDRDYVRLKPSLTGLLLERSKTIRRTRMENGERIVTDHPHDLQVGDTLEIIKSEFDVASGGMKETSESLGAVLGFWGMLRTASA